MPAVNNIIVRNLGESPSTNYPLAKADSGDKTTANGITTLVLTKANLYGTLTANTNYTVYIAGTGGTYTFVSQTPNPQYGFDLRFQQ